MYHPRLCVGRAPARLYITHTGGRPAALHGLLGALPRVRRHATREEAAYRLPHDSGQRCASASTACLLVCRSKGYINKTVCVSLLRVACVYAVVLAACYSLLTAHCSLLTAHCSLLTTHYSLLTTYCRLEHGSACQVR